jgi:hypothetical protein
MYTASSGGPLGISLDEEIPYDVMCMSDVDAE